MAIRAWVFACLYAVPAALGASEAVDVYTTLEDIDSDRPSKLELNFKFYPVGAEHLRGAKLRCKSIRAIWMASGKNVFEQDALLPTEGIEIKWGEASETHSAKIPIPALIGTHTVRFVSKFVVDSEAGAREQFAENTLRAVVSITPNPAPVSVRGANPAKKHLVILDGSKSTPESESLTYQWVQTLGDDLKLPAAQLSKDRVGLYVYKTGAYTFRLTVSDGANKRAQAEVTLIVGDGLSPEAKVEFRNHRIGLLWLTVSVLVPGALLALLLRRWIRIHLLTALVMLLAAGVMLAVNSHETSYATGNVEPTVPHRIDLQPGWPKSFEFNARYWDALVIDGLLFAGAVLIAALISEWLMRRRKTDGPEPRPTNDSTSATC